MVFTRFDAYHYGDDPDAVTLQEDAIAPPPIFPEETSLIARCDKITAGLDRTALSNLLTSSNNPEVIHAASVALSELHGI